MEASGGGGRGSDLHRSRRAESLGFHNGTPPAAIFRHHQTLITDPTDAADRPTNSSSSNPDPVSFAFAAPSSPGQPSMTSPPPSAGKTKPTASSSTGVRYRECRRNHAASVGGSVLDGCGEFMPAGEDGTLDALRCAACDCHRNFHRRESDTDPSPLSSSAYRRPPALHLPALPAPPSAVHHHHHGPRPPPPYGSLSIVPPMSVAFGGGGGGGTESSSEDLNLFGTTTPTGHGHGHHHQPSAAYFGSSSSKSSKRFRTKFTQEQKEKMMEFAEKIGWRIQRQFEDEVERFCAEAGVKRQVFKVWMHNNKNATKSSPATKQQQISAMDREEEEANDREDHHHRQDQEH